MSRNEKRYRSRSRERRSSSRQSSPRSRRSRSGWSGSRQNSPHSRSHVRWSGSDNRLRDEWETRHRHHKGRSSSRNQENDYIRRRSLSPDLKTLIPVMREKDYEKIKKDPNQVEKTKAHFYKKETRKLDSINEQKDFYCRDGGRSDLKRKVFQTSKRCAERSLLRERFEDVHIIAGENADYAKDKEISQDRSKTDEFRNAMADPSLELEDARTERLLREENEKQKHLREIKQREDAAKRDRERLEQELAEKQHEIDLHTESAKALREVYQELFDSLNCQGELGDHARRLRDHATVQAAKFAELKRQNREFHKKIKQMKNEETLARQEVEKAMRNQRIIEEYYARVQREQQKSVELAKINATRLDLRADIARKEEEMAEIDAKLAVFEEVKTESTMRNSVSLGVCLICQDHMKATEFPITMPCCRFVFHCECIDRYRLSEAEKGHRSKHKHKSKIADMVRCPYCRKDHSWRKLEPQNWKNEKRRRKELENAKKKEPQG